MSDVGPLAWAWAWAWAWAFPEARRRVAAIFTAPPPTTAGARGASVRLRRAQEGRHFCGRHKCYVEIRRKHINLGAVQQCKLPWEGTVHTAAQGQSVRRMRDARFDARRVRCVCAPNALPAAPISIRPRGRSAPKSKFGVRFVSWREHSSASLRGRPASDQAAHR